MTKKVREKYNAEVILYEEIIRMLRFADDIVMEK